MTSSGDILLAQQKKMRENLRNTNRTMVIATIYAGMIAERKDRFFETYMQAMDEAIHHADLLLLKIYPEPK